MRTKWRAAGKGVAGRGTAGKVFRLLQTDEQDDNTTQHYRRLNKPAHKEGGGGRRIDKSEQERHTEKRNKQHG